MAGLPNKPIITPFKSRIDYCKTYLSYNQLRELKQNWIINDKIMMNLTARVEITATSDTGQLSMGP